MVRYRMDGQVMKVTTTQRMELTKMLSHTMPEMI
jgi:hypothetical protein